MNNFNLTLLVITALVLWAVVNLWAIPALLVITLGAFNIAYLTHMQAVAVWMVLSVLKSVLKSLLDIK